MVPDGSGQARPTYLVGAPVPTGAGSAERIELYYAFPLDQEAESLSLFRSTVVISGIALTLFVVGIALLVTRLVVDPVRRAAGTAQRLAEGQLEERMVVRGEDDLARLATSFNAMADSLQRQITQLEGLSQLQQRFTSDVSHELRTPLTTVQMAADVLHEARADFPSHVARSAELLKGELDATTAAIAKLWVSEAQGELVDACLQLHGGYGYINDYPIARAWRDARVQRIYGGSSEIMKLLIARSL